MKVTGRWPPVRIAAAQTPEIRENVDEALGCLVDFASRAEAAGASLLCCPEGFLRGYLLDEEAARRHALELDSPAFAALLDQVTAQLPLEAPGLLVFDIPLDGPA